MVFLRAIGVNTLVSLIFTVGRLLVDRTLATDRRRQTLTVTEPLYVGGTDLAEPGAALAGNVMLQGHRTTLTQS